jgi:hypothetical protein
MSRSILPGHTVTRYTVVIVQLSTDEIVSTDWQIIQNTIFRTFPRLKTQYLQIKIRTAFAKQWTLSDRLMI